MSRHLAYLFSRYPVPSQTFCDTEMMALERMGWKITVGALNGPTSSFRHERLLGLEAEQVYPVPGPILDQPGEGPQWEALQAMVAEHAAKYGSSYKSDVRARNAWWFAQELRKRGISHIHVHFANRATHTALFLKKLGFTFSFTAHAQDFMLDLGSDDLLREMAQEAEFVVAVSDFSRNLLAKICPEAEPKMFRVYNGLDPSEFVPVPLPPRLGALEFRIVSVGRLVEFKGFNYLIEAIANLKQRGRKIRLDIVGEGPERANLEAQIANLGVGDCVHLLGLQSQQYIKQLLHDCHCFALACVVDSKGGSDVLPTVILEAMATGRPVVSTRLVGVPEMVVDGESGLLVEPKNAGALANALDMLVLQNSVAQRMAAEGREHFLNKFTDQHSAGAMAQLFQQVVPEMHTLATPPPALILGNRWPLESADATGLEDRKDYQLLAAESISKPGDSRPTDLMRFLPDALVLESYWRGHSEQVAQLERLYAHCGTVPGEIFFREARRALWTALQLSHWGVRRVHAWRSENLLWAWLVMKLTGATGTFALEQKPVLGRSVLDAILGDFTAGSISDDKVAEKWGTKFPDRLQLKEPTGKKGLFGGKKSSSGSNVWSEWLRVG